MILKKTFFRASLAVILLHTVFSQEAVNQNGGEKVFRFKYSKGDTYRIFSTVEEDVYINGSYVQHSTIANRIGAEIIDVDENKTATISSNFMTSEVATEKGNHLNFGHEDNAVFKVDVYGNYTSDEKDFIPSVRNVPVFPEKEIAPGERWTGKGIEVYDFRETFKLENPFTAPFDVNYQYIGKEGRLDVFSVSYTTYVETPGENLKSSLDFYPVSMSTHSEEKIYWDNEKGYFSHYTEDFKIAVKTSTGETIEYKGKAKAEVSFFPKTSTEENISNIQEKVDDLGIENVSVTQGEKGLTLSIEDIKFKADSSVLQESEKIKLKQIAQILMQYPDNDILITGHTALAGTEKERNRLSKERADAVAEYLEKEMLSGTRKIFTQGLGASKPVDSNKTEKGKARNRRVEITIMDK